MLHDWPGNVRELANVIQRAVVLAPYDLITPDLLLLGREAPHKLCPKLGSLKEAQEGSERAYLVRVLTATRGNVSQAEHWLGGTAPISISSCASMPWTQGLSKVTRPRSKVWRGCITPAT